jgi:hypothetical protein
VVADRAVGGIPVDELPALDVGAVQGALPVDVPVPAPVSLLAGPVGENTTERGE